MKKIDYKGYIRTRDTLTFILQDNTVIKMNILNSSIGKPISFNCVYLTGLDDKGYAVYCDGSLYEL